MKKYSKIIKKLIKWGIIIAIVIVAGTFVYQKFIAKMITPTKGEASVITTATVEKRDIQNVLSSSGTIEPIASYEVTTLVQGEVIAANFQEGDIVQEGQVLYQIATDTLDSQIETSETAVTRAERDYTKAEDSYQDSLTNYKEAQDDYNEAKADYDTAVDEGSNREITSTETGIVKTLFVKVGDTLQKGAQIAEVYDNSTMLLVVPFSASEVDSSLIGKTANVVINDTFESLKGKVTKVSTIEEVLSGNRLVKKVTIEVSNPGALTETTQASASIGNLYSMDSGAFTVKTNAIITSDLSGEIAYIGLEEGKNVKKGDVILKITDEEIDDQLENYSKAIDNAQNTIENAKETLESKKEAIEDAKSSLQDVIDTRTDYSITSPVTGKVITKNILKGDTIGSSNFNSTLCVIYDLSSVKFEMSVDELDVMKVAENQEVEITADALDGVEIKGTVTNVSLESTTNQGVTQYPVTVQIADVGDLLPGMNVTGKIIIEKVEGVLAIPSDALQRGDIVYVKDDTATSEANGTVTKDSENTAKDDGTTTNSGTATQNNSGTMPNGSGNSATPNNSGTKPNGSGTSPNDSGRMPNASGNSAIPNDNGTKPNASGVSKDGSGTTSKVGTVTKTFSNIPEGYRAVEVTTGITDGDYIEITSGLTEGEVIYLTRTTTSDSSALEDMMAGFSMDGKIPEGQMPAGNGQWPSNGNRPGGFSGGFPSN